jgi:ribonuclease HI
MSLYDDINHDAEQFASRMTDYLFNYVERRTTRMKKYVVYADGASSNNHVAALRVGGWAFCVFRKGPNGGTEKAEKSGKVDGATNNQMELTGLIEALKFIRSIDPTAKAEEVSVTFFGDSNYVVKGITEGLPYWKSHDWRLRSKEPVKNPEIWKELDDLLNKVTLHTEKVKGDGNDRWNSHCDIMARAQSGSNPKR